MVELSGGLELMPFLIGLLALSVFAQIEKSADMSRFLSNVGMDSSSRRDDHRVSWKEFKECIRTIFAPYLSVLFWEPCLD